MNPTAVNLQPKSQDDVWNFESWLEPFLRNHSQSITAAVLDYRARLTDAERDRDESLLEVDVSNPVIFINFDIPWLPTVKENVQMAHPDSLDGEFHAKNTGMEVTRRWKLNAGQYLVYGFFPTISIIRGRERLSWVFELDLTSRKDVAETTSS